MTQIEKHVLFHYARSVSEGAVIAEIGSYHGASSCCLAAGAARRKSVAVWCIDTWMNDAVSDERADIFPIWTKHTQPFMNILRPHRGFSHEVTDTLPDNIALLFVDGDHSYDGVTRDIKLYLPKIKHGGILIMHDYSHASVARAIHDHIFVHKQKRLAVLPNLFACRVYRHA